MSAFGGDDWPGAVRSWAQAGGEAQVREAGLTVGQAIVTVNRGTLTNQLARVLAPRADGLLLTSATPHNGDPKSFAELIRLLDPAAIVDPDATRRSRDALVAAADILFLRGKGAKALNTTK